MRVHHHLIESLVEAERNQSVIVVARDGLGNFSSIAEAIDSIPEQNQQRVIVWIKAGVYREKIAIPKSKPFVTLQGDGSSLTIITWNSTASDRNGTNLLKTYNSATISINSRFFIAKNITFQNEAIAHIHGETGKQAVALRISADMAAFYDCNFHGGQDTLYDHKGRHYFKRCFVQGSVDFIFGYGRSLYKDCHLYSIANKTGAITAQKRTIRNMNSGFSFVNCSITGSGRIYLGRAWGDRSRVVYSYTYMDALIAPQGWQNWNHPERNRTVFFAQYECSGPGAKTSQRVAWARTLTFEEAQPFLDTDFIHGETWLLST
ncbi:hypothetical protein SELMODRAFT_101090 [Selaginella moellendorffii]|uniref:Pectinesterase n=1 Tax=Selaginella moellendorffii TaxID=88036 RepID=D8RSX7_SELML|nr:hypothetical protein SELMODRAFT_101090 [Selaginella moellendorffii]